MTTARDAWLRARQRRRAVVSWSTALGAYALALLVSLLLSLLAVEDLSDYSGPVVVRLGSPDGTDAAKPAPEPRPSPVTPVESPAARPAEPAPPPPAPTPTAAKGSPAKAAPTAAAPPTAAKATAAKATAAPASPAVPAPEPAPPEPPKVVLRGSESGNSYDMTLMAGAGVVGRGFYVPIWLFMPVPNELPASTYDAIPDRQGLPGTAAERKALFASAYEKKGDAWVLKRFRQPDYELRQALWIMLEEAGYDVKNAEYKAGKYLRPVVILFKVSAPGAGGEPLLEAVHVESSSGYSTIDADVIYGFRKAQFYNSGASSINGRFTYRF